MVGRRALGLLVVLVMFLAACGGSEREEVGSSDASETSGDDSADDGGSDNEEGGFADFDGDVERAEQAQLVVADFPDGWGRDEPDDEDEDDDIYGEQYAECVGADDSLVDLDWPSSEASFSGDGFQTVESSIEFAPSTDRAEDMFSMFTSDDALGCLDDALRALAAEDPEFDGSIEIVSVDRRDGPAAGADSAWFRVTMDMSSEGFEVTVLVDLVLARVDRALVSVSAVAASAPFDEETLVGYLTLIVDRLNGDAPPGERSADDPASGSDGESEQDPPAAAEATVVAGMTTGVNSNGTRYTTAGALVTNPNPDLGLYEADAVFNLVAADGRVLDTASVSVPYIAGGATVPVAPLQIGFDLSEEPASVDVVMVGDFRDDQGWDGVDAFSLDGVELVVSNPTFTPGQYSDKVQFQAQNPSDTVVEDGSWDCVLRAGGTITGGVASGFSDPIAPGRSLSVDSTVSVDGLAVDEVLCRAYA